ncbi:ATP-binding cassette domain-containing protein [Alkalibaculum bacchi]|uniref:ATP-binding cassette domain-containing protein n=1 Tax=Alkalibaculum bacchi TaxID=645887 RepID=UPI0026EE24EF|nr:ATP-binding cassette domain-containing protein [Alkalibaculum bacchi]
MEDIVSIKDVRMKVGEFQLGPIDLDIKRGEVFAFLGKTGAGKTLLMELIGGFYTHYEGTIQVFSDVPVGIVLQEYALFPHLTVAENIAYGLKCHHYSKSETQKKVKDITSFFGINHLLGQYPDTLSGGEKQRTALARTMAIRPDLLLLDEPFSALDVATKERIYGQILKIKEEFDCTIVIITHDFHEAIRLADRVGILLHGKVKDVVAPGELFVRRQDNEVNEFLGIGENVDKKRTI